MRCALSLVVMIACGSSPPAARPIANTATGHDSSPSDEDAIARIVLESYVADPESMPDRGLLAEAARTEAQAPAAAAKKPRARA